MELSEDLKYRLAFLTMRVAFDDKLSKSDDLAKYPGILLFLDTLAGTHLASEAAGKRYASQRDKLESFIDAEFGEELLEQMNKAIAELIS